MNIWEYMTSCNMKAFKFPTDMFVGSTLYPWVSLLENKLGILCLLFRRRWDLTPQTEGMCRLQICGTRQFEAAIYNGCERGGKWARGQTCKESWPIFVNQCSVNGWLHDSLWKRGSTSPFLQLLKTSSHAATNPRPNTSTSIGLHLYKHKLGFLPQGRGHLGKLGTWGFLHEFILSTFTSWDCIIMVLLLVNQVLKEIWSVPEWPMAVKLNHQLNLFDV